jgi:hypothetical protein
MTDTPAPPRQPTSKPHKQVNQENDHHRQKGHDSNVLPPHPPPQSPAPYAELVCAASKPIRLVDQKIDPLAPLKQALNILTHNAPHIINLSLRIRNRVLLAALRRAILHHQLFQLRIKTPRPITLHTCEVIALDGEVLQEALSDLDEEAEGDASSHRRVRDYEIGEAAGGGVRGGVLGGRGGDVVDIVVIVRVG